MAIETIDAHHHLWKYAAEDYPWMGDGMETIRRDFLVGELSAVLSESGIDGTIAVQALQSVRETEWLLGLAGPSELIRGVVGWVPLVDPKAGKVLEQLGEHKKLRGVRHVLHDEADDFYMLREDFNLGIGLLKEFRLRYDILIFERHLPQTIEFVDRHPNQIFVVDHVAKPRIKDRLVSPWQTNIGELARRENVYCKLSGMVTEADWETWTRADLQPYVDTALESFGPSRIMFGSDWPVVLVAGSYKLWVDTVRGMIASLSTDEQERIMGGTAKEAYGLA
jgi:L-fuconolactonase